ncbi:tandem-95 repeat protein [Naumannella sp. ID2617S]|nr:tandem-95 repeat protein [Naumannella sp. ID2617S]
MAASGLGVSMGMRQLVRRLPALLTALLGLALVVAAVVVPSSPAAEVDLHDGSVLVTNSNRSLIGRLNHEIDRLASSVSMVNRDFDVLQDGRNALSRDRAANQLQTIDAAQSRLGTPMIVPANATVALGNETVAIVNPTNGRMWARPMSSIFTVDTIKARSDLDLGPGGTATVTTAGQALGLSVERGEVVRPGGDQKPVKVPIRMAITDGVQLSAVGDRAVVLNQATRQVWVEGSDPVEVPDAATALLAPPAADKERVQVTEPGILPRQRTVDAVLATRTGLLGVGEGRLLTLAEAAGTPVRPLVAAGCAYGTFVGGPATAAQLCTGSGPTLSQVPEYTPGGSLVLRRNRDVAVLNDTQTGNVWLLDKNLKLVRDWDPVVPPKPTEGGKENNQDQTQQVPPQRSEANRPPRARDDTLSARAGRATVLPVLDNDSDPDGDILTVDRVPEAGAGQLALVRGGTTLQLTLPADAPRVLSFDYTVSDGRGGKATARVNLNVLPADQSAANQPPALRPGHDKPIDVPLGGRETRRVLLDWVDPDGDDLLLVKAKAPGDDEVTFSPDGTLTFTDVGTKPGRKEIELEISDGQATSRGVLVLNARRPADVAPVANGDYVAASAGNEVVVRPMLNDTGANLTLSAVDQVRGATVTPDFPAGQFTFRADNPGTYYVGYTISNGPRATGLVRIDVSSRSVSNRPPVAARDVALLPAGGSVEVDPLANDEDPDGDVLVLQSVGEHPDLKVQLRQRRGLTITAVNTPTRPVTLRYTVSDGHSQITGTLVVVPAPAVTDTRPIAAGDEATVRAGDQVSVPVLANDTSPIGAKLTLDKELAEQPTPAVAWTDGENVRFIAPTVPGEYRAVYRIRDEQGQEASAQVRFLVVAADVENTPPEPRPVEGRVLAGAKGRILVPLQGIDPQGDAVRLIGIDTAPKLGRVVTVGERWLEYEAYPTAAGTDTFRYAITDALGARATGEVRVGVVPRGAANTAPTTLEDKVVAKPGRRIKVPVLTNDTDPDGDRFGFAEKALDFPREHDAALAGDLIELTIPAAPGTSQGQYQVVDTRGADATGTVVVTADPNAPPAPPIARDDMVSAAAVARENEIAVPVLANDIDPDGDLKLATVTLPDAAAIPESIRPRVVGDRVQVKVGPKLQQVRYAVTDSDGQTAHGVITVPGRADSVPARAPGVPDPVVIAGESIDLPLSRFVIGTGAKEVTLTTEDRIWAAHGEVQPLDLRKLRFTAPGLYAGPTAVTFEVTDGRNSSDPEGRRAVITVPITVLPKAPDKPRDDPGKPLNQPPRAQPVTLTVGAGEEPRTIDLRRSVTDPEGEEVIIAKPTGEVPTGITMTTEATRVTARAELTTRPGTSAKLKAEAKDSHGGTTMIDLTIVVASSARPRAKALDDNVPNANQGRAVTVPVLANDANPFPERGPLNLLQAVVESGSGQAQVADGKVVVTPGAEFVGTMVVRYQVEDATKDPSRYAEGRVRLTVRGKPSRPGVPRATEVGDQRAVLTWSAPADNGARITGYRLTASSPEGGQSVDCRATTCTVPGLKNNVVHTFTVVAINEVGQSPASAASAGVRPDVHPDPPGRPSTRFGDRSATVSWPAAQTRGSAVNRYVVQITGPSGSQTRQVNGSTTELVWDGLTNGASYRFRVQAYNQAPTPSDFSAWSDPVEPAGRPSAPRQVTASDSGGVLGQQVTVSWQPPASANGAEIDNYVVLANGRKIADAGRNTRMQFTLENGMPYSFSVIAHNKAGDGPASGATEPLTPYGAPGTAAAPRLHEGDKLIRADAFQAPTNGASITRWRVRLNNGQILEVSAADAAKGWQLAATNGQTYSISVIACSGTKCAQSWSPASNQATPRGVPGAVPVDAKSNVGFVSVAWDSTIGNNNGSPITKTEIRIDGGQWEKVDPKGRRDLPSTPGQEHRIDARATNEAGTGPEGTAAAKAR